MDKTKLKKVIAREGLIIIALALSISAVAFIDSKVPSSKEYTVNELIKQGVFVEGPRDLLDESSGTAPKSLTDSIMSLNDDQTKRLARTVLCERKELNIWAEVPSEAERSAEVDLKKLSDSDLAWLGHVNVKKLWALPQDKKTTAHLLFDMLFKLLVAFYPLYCLARFIIWALNMLQEKDRKALKKIIAKHGLIIVGICLLSFVFIKIRYVSFDLPFHEVNYAVVPEHSFSKFVDKENGKELPVVDFKNGMSIVFNQKPSEQEIEAAYTKKDKVLGSRIFWDDDTFLKIGFVSLNVKFGNLAFDFDILGRWLLLLGYPFYWLIRFVIWAVKTLKKDN